MGYLKANLSSSYANIARMETFLVWVPESTGASDVPANQQRNESSQ